MEVETTLMELLLLVELVEELDLIYLLEELSALQMMVIEQERLGLLIFGI